MRTKTQSKDPYPGQPLPRRDRARTSTLDYLRAERVVILEEATKPSQEAHDGVKRANVLTTLRI